MTESTINPLSGLWKPHHLQALHYGPSCVEKHLLSLLPSPSSKAFIITGSSIANKTPLVKQVERILGSAHHAGTFSNIKQHAPIAQLDEATTLVAADPHIDTLISIGGGSPIDSAKAISHRQHEQTGSFLFHIAIPTTLSAAECTQIAGYTKADGVKTGINHPSLAPQAILYDATFAAHTPLKLWLATGMRAMDHAVETQYHPTASLVPGKAMALHAAAQLFELLPRAKLLSHPAEDEDVATRLMLAAFASLAFIGLNLKGGLGLSHALGYALGSPYGIPHGETSCLTLGRVVKLKARGGGGADGEDARSIARLGPGFGVVASGDAERDAEEVGERIMGLVEGLGLGLGLTETLGQRGVGKDQVGVIVERATGGLKEGKQYDAVKALVEELW